MTKAGTTSNPGVCLPWPKILQAGGGAGGGPAATGCCMVEAGSPGPGMAVAGQGYEPTPQGR